MIPNLSHTWVYLSTSPLVWLTATLLAYRFAMAVYVKTKFHPLANPVAIAIVILVLILLVTKTPYKTYFDGAQFVHFLLGPVTVALAIPLYQQLDKLKRNWFALLSGAVIGGIVAIGTAMGVAWALGASHTTVLSIASKSVTTPIAMGITEKLGGVPSLTAVLVMLTGVLGGIIALPILDALKIKDDSTRGFAMGATAHGIGIARGFQASYETGAFAGLAMGLCAVLTAILLPLALKILGVI
jgi:predicted murein hydrolase (TIGR00659 family)